MKQFIKSDKEQVKRDLESMAIGFVIAAVITLSYYIVTLLIH